jgi:hypothetical protein
MDFLDGILKEKGPQLIGALTSQAGFSPDQAEKFVPAAGSAVMDTMKSQAGNLDFDNLSSASNVKTIMGGIDAGSLASIAGVTPQQSVGGITAIVPMLLGLIGSRAGGASGLLAMLTGSGAGKLGKLGKLFGR